MEKIFTLNENKIVTRRKQARWSYEAMQISWRIFSTVKRVIGLTQSKGVLVKENAKTVIVRLPDGNIIKRHKVKHEVK